MINELDKKMDALLKELEALKEKSFIEQIEDIRKQINFKEYSNRKQALMFANKVDGVVTRYDKPFEYKTNKKGRKHSRMIIKTFFRVEY